MKTTNMLKHGFFIFAIVATAAGCATTTAVRRHTDFPKERGSGMRVGIMPLDAHITKATFAGDDEPMVEVQDGLCTNMPVLIAEMLEARAFEVVQRACGESFLSERPELRYELTQTQQAFGQALTRLFPPDRPMLIPEAEAFASTETFGPGVNVFADALDVDALLFVRCVGFKKSGGERTKDLTKSFLIGFATLGLATRTYASKYLSLESALVDGATGEVLWAHCGRKIGAFEKEKDLQLLLDYVFGPLPGVGVQGGSEE